MAIIDSPEAKNKIKSALNDISDSYYRIAGEQDNIKEIVNSISKEFEIPKTIVSKMARCYHKESYDKEMKDAEDFSNYYETVVGIQEN